VTGKEEIERNEKVTEFIIQNLISQNPLPTTTKTSILPMSRKGRRRSSIHNVDDLSTKETSPDTSKSPSHHSKHKGKHKTQNWPTFGCRWSFFTFTQTFPPLPS